MSNYNQGTAIEIYYGKWRIPRGSSKICTKFNDFTGILYYYGCRDSILEIYTDTKSFQPIDYNDGATIYGENAYMTHLALFSPKQINYEPGRITFSVKYFITGHGSAKIVSSLDSKVYRYCYADYPSLRGWAFKNILKHSVCEQNNIISWNATDGIRFEVEIENGIKFSIVSGISSYFAIYDQSIKQSTRVLISSEKEESIEKFTRLIAEFSRFLSLATFAKQSPSAITLKRNEDIFPLSEEHLKFSVCESEQPPFGTVIKFEEIVAKRSEVLIRWHENYEQMSPITKRLVQSVTEQKDDFDAPDFLIIAEALDGYFKRFENNRDGKDTRKYKDQITKLLEKFEDVTVLQQCNLDATVLAHSRNKYSHLIPDNDMKGIEKAVSGDGLFYLTQQAIVLLTCCVLDNLGLTSDEINICFKDSVIEHIVNDIPLWYREYIKQL